MFGVFLNKSKPPVSSQSGDDGNTGDKRAATWKLRKWTRGQGYKTVVKVEDVEEREEGKEKDIKSSQTHLVADEAGASIPDQLQVSKYTLVILYAKLKMEGN